jgi:hypothetical protein
VDQRPRVEDHRPNQESQRTKVEKGRKIWKKTRAFLDLVVTSSHLLTKWLFLLSFFPTPFRKKIRYEEVERFGFREMGEIRAEDWTGNYARANADVAVNSTEFSVQERLIG